MSTEKDQNKALNKTDVSSSYNIKPTDFDAMICLFEQLNITYEVLKGLNKFFIINRINTTANNGYTIVGLIV